MHSLKSLDGGILDQDDRLGDVVDDREQVEPDPRLYSVVISDFMPIKTHHLRFSFFTVA